MPDSPEFAGQANPRQHLIDLGLPDSFIDMMQIIFREAPTLEDTDLVIRQGHVKTALGGTQLTQPVIKLLYADDPNVRDFFRQQLEQFQVLSEVLDTYFTATQYGYISLRLRYPNIDSEFLERFIPAADNMAYSFLRSYFGFGSAETDIEAK